jgi:hypothetical protein
MSADLRYPIGQFEIPQTADAAEVQAAIDEIAGLPPEVSAAITGFTDEQLDTPYRDGGWTVRQVVHHLVDSHGNSYVRMKLAVTEDNPVIKAYDEKAWAAQEEARTAPVSLSLPLLYGLHGRWSAWMRTLDAAAFARTSQHPDWGTIRLDVLILLYAWHCRHHVAHITALRKREGWT